jgi:hypothetical protein
MWADLPETQDLLDQARAGYPAAVERLLTAHREPLRRMIDLRLDPALAARVDASDIVQDVLLEAHRRLNEYLRDPVMPFRLWLRHIAKSTPTAATASPSAAASTASSPSSPPSWPTTPPPSWPPSSSIRSVPPPPPPSRASSSAGSAPPSPTSTRMIAR